MGGHEEDGHMRMGRLVDRRRAQQQEDRLRSLELDRAALSEAVSSRIRTTMIGSIAAIEEELGFLWGQGGVPAGLDVVEADVLVGLAGLFDAARERLRTRILNLGNHHRRSAEAEIDRLDVAPRLYGYEFEFQNRKDG